MALLAVLGSALLAAYAKEPPQAIRIGINSYPAYELLYLAQEKGFYRQERVDVKIVEFSSLSDVTVSMANGQIDALVTYPPYATRLLADPRLRKSFDTSSVPGEVIDVLAFPDALVDGRWPAV